MDAEGIFLQNFQKILKYYLVTDSDMWVMGEMTVWIMSEQSPFFKKSTERISFGSFFQNFKKVFKEIYVPVIVIEDSKHFFHTASYYNDQCTAIIS